MNRAIKRRENCRVRAEVAVELRSGSWPDQEGEEPVPVDAALEQERSLDVEGIPTAECVLPDRRPKRTLEEPRAAAAKPVLLHAVRPDVCKLSRRHDARDLPEHAVDERASTPAVAADVENFDPAV